MDPTLKAAAVIGFTAIACFAYVKLDDWRKKKRKEAKLKGAPSGFAARRRQMLEEIESRKSAEQRYRESIDKAFETARNMNMLYVVEAPYDDIESDSYRTRRPGTKTRLTRIYPILTVDLAEKIREYEIQASACVEDHELRGEIYLASRAINWRLVEVHEECEPPNLKDEDRIRYPDLGMYHTIPKELRDAARQLLDYGDEYVQEKGALLEQKADAGFEVADE